MTLSNGFQGQDVLPADIVHLMVRFGRYEFKLQTDEDEAQAMGQLTGKLYSIGTNNPQGFLAALADAVLPVGGWAVYGASHMLWEIFSSSVSAEILQNTAYIAINTASIDFLRTSGVTTMWVTGYEWDHWYAMGGTAETWPKLSRTK